MKSLTVNFKRLMMTGFFMLVGTLMGQGPPGMGPRHMMDIGGPPVRMQDREMMRGMHRGRGQGAMFRIWKMTEYLDLTEDQGAKFFPRFNKHKDLVDGIREEQETLSIDFMERVEAGKFGKRATEAYLEKINKLEQRQLEQRYTHVRGTSDLLSEEQFARYAAFDDHFRRQIKERMSGRNMQRGWKKGRNGEKANKFKKKVK